MNQQPFITIVDQILSATLFAGRGQEIEKKEGIWARCDIIESNL
jgi:hypothetical protein